MACNSKIYNFSSYRDISFDEIKKDHVRIYYFGLGFIQVVLNQRFRLHFYSPRLAVITDSPHNHRYDFYSRVLKGALRNTIYEKCRGSDQEAILYVKSKESCSLDDSLVKKHHPSKDVFLKEVRSFTTVEREAYFLAHDVIHSVSIADHSKDCITLLDRSGYAKKKADVYNIKGEEALCPFSKAKEISEDTLWNIIKDMLEGEKND